jgi:FkbM family methyltransferase
MREDTVTLIDKIYATRSYFNNISAATKAFGLLGMLKVVMLRFRVIGKITVDLNGKRFTLTMENFQDFWRDEVSIYTGGRIRFLGDEARFTYRGKSVVFKINDNKRVRAQTGLLINEQFFGQQYKFAARKRDVVDIGANVGDSPIYFALNGAKRVYAYEPFPYIYGRARRNISANHLEKKIFLYNEGVGGRNSSVILPSNYIDGGSDIRNPKSKGQKTQRVRIITLGSIVKKHGLHNALLKSDCEGSEYDIFFNADNRTLQAFDEMVIEYHYGYIGLKKRLEDAGFQVSVGRPLRMLHADGSRSSYAGLMYARRARIDSSAATRAT